MCVNFYDTSALLELQDKIFDSNEKFLISSITFKELENIKTSYNKDLDIKYKARKIINLLYNNQEQYDCILYTQNLDDRINNSSFLILNDDSRIIMTAKNFQENKGVKLLFITADLLCERLAAALGLNTSFIQNVKDPYTGYVEINCRSDDELADAYEKIYSIGDNPFQLINNQYLLVKDVHGNIIDKYKFKNNQCVRLPDFIGFESRMFGKVKSKDAYQFIAMDSLSNNKITLLRGSAGTGKSYLAISYLFSLLEKNKIDRIIIFCNTVATAGSAKLGFYPGTRDEKLLDSQIGNFLISKIGDRGQVEDLINKGIILLLPMSDIRGFDTSGMNAGIYITEAQNMDIEMMKLALQRIGEDSICIIDGDDETQVDMALYAGNNNGMKRVSKIFRGENIYGEVTLPIIYRSKVAQIADKM